MRDRGHSMKCGQCGSEMEADEEREHKGRKLCEDCYMDALSPVRTCDPWAVHNAKSLGRYAGKMEALTPIQSEILSILKEAGAIEPSELLRKLGGKMTLKELEREIATLRHMEKVRVEKQGDRVLSRLS